MTECILFREISSFMLRSTRISARTFETTWVRDHTVLFMGLMWIILHWLALAHTVDR